MQEIQTFDFSEMPVRVMERAGTPWFVAADVCRVLDIANPRDAVESLDDDEKFQVDRMTVANSDGQGRGGAQRFNIISESGLYALIFRSRKPEARAFRRWVTQEVLPQIRQTGQYVLPAGVQRVQEALERSIHDLGLGRIDISRARAVSRMHRQYMLALKGESDRLSIATGRGAGGVIPETTSASAFLENRCRLEPGAMISKDELFAAYEEFCRAEGTSPKKREAFCRALYELHPEVDVARFKYRKPEYHFVGITLRQEEGKSHGE